ncbi:MAG: hypothetical protein JRD04_04445 [Deltaproteobacteria bacterium]|nr:hypothetical protein [Deltaproteobacteria bacterium]
MRLKTGCVVQTLMFFLVFTLFSHIYFLTLRSAFAGEIRKKNIPNQILCWIPPKKDVMGYIEKTKDLLSHVSDQVFVASRIDATYQDLFKQIVIATAWQESCFQ